MTLCRHCGRNVVSRPRGLCWACYYTPGLRDGYPSTSKFARRGLGSRTPKLFPVVPTEAPPGSPEKVETLAGRVAAGVHLWHPRDAGKEIPE